MVFQIRYILRILYGVIPGSNHRSNHPKANEHVSLLPKIHSKYIKSFDSAVSDLEKLLPELVETWQSNQNKIFLSCKPPADWENKLHNFYNLVWQQLPPKMQSCAPKPNIFNTLTLQAKSICFNYVKLSIKSEYYKAIKNILKNLNKTNSEELLKCENICKCLFGGEKHNDLADPLLQLINSSINDYLVKAFEDFSDAKILFLGSGTVGIAFKLNISGHEFVIKLPKVPADRQLFKHFQYEQKQLRLYHDLVRKGLNPEKLLIPELICNADGNPLSIDDSITVTKFYKGEKLSSKTSSEVNQKYIEKGLSDKFLLDFIKLYMEFVKAGADLSDISVENYFYNADTKSLEFFEFAGFDPEHSKKFTQLKELRDFSSCSSLVFTLLTAISTLEHQTFGIGYASAIKTDAQSIGQEKVFDKRIEQLQRVLQKALKQKILDSQELKIGIVHLYDVCSSPDVSPNLKITSKGLEYLRFLKDWIAGRPR